MRIRTDHAHFLCLLSAHVTRLHGFWPILNEIVITALCCAIIFRSRLSRTYLRVSPYYLTGNQVACQARLPCSHTLGLTSEEASAEVRRTLVMGCVMILPRPISPGSLTFLFGLS